MKVEVRTHNLQVEVKLTKVQGCGKGPHLPTPEKPPKELSKPSIPLDLPLSSEGGTEVFASGPSVPKSISQPSTTPKPANTNPAFVEEEDDSTVDITPGTQCRRNGCKVEFVSNEENRHGDGDGTVCTYHPGAVSALYPSVRQMTQVSASQSSTKVAKCVSSTASQTILCSQ